MMLKSTFFIKISALFLLGISFKFVNAQENLPVGFSAGELLEMKRSDWQPAVYESKTSITSPPPGPVRNYAQWEETQALTVTWISYTPVIREIVRAARLETQVYIICGTTCSGVDSNSVKTYLTAGGVPLTNVHYIHAPCNSVWTRDYSSNSCYLNDVDSLIMVDWKYNRPTRGKDDTVSHSLARAAPARIIPAILCR